MTGVRTVKVDFSLRFLILITTPASLTNPDSGRESTMMTELQRIPGLTWAGLHVAANRYAVFGRTPECMVPAGDLLQRFLL